MDSSRPEIMIFDVEKDNREENHRRIRGHNRIPANAGRERVLLSSGAGPTPLHHAVDSIEETLSPPTSPS
ncbi:hypothetical protein NL676_001116 [Syzygium grande]|nr:hypothetical protein NL676_001116 [Syzygium grande]